MRTYRHRQTVNAIQWDGSLDCALEILGFCRGDELELRVINNGDRFLKIILPGAGLLESSEGIHLQMIPSEYIFFDIDLNRFVVYSYETFEDVWEDITPKDADPEELNVNQFRQNLLPRAANPTKY